MVAQGNMDALLSDISHDVEFVPQYQKLNELFTALRSRRKHLAVVVDEFGVMRGIVTLEDLVEELFGEIYDESDKAQSPTGDQEGIRERGQGRRGISSLYQSSCSGAAT